MIAERTLSHRGKRMLRVVDRPGYFGKKRPTRIEFYNNLYGEGRWQEQWQVGDRIVGFDEAVLLYDHSYLVYLSEQRLFAQHIARLYADCYDNDPSNVACGLSHDPVSSPRHIQDVSVRRALAALGLAWQGPEGRLLEIRGPESDGYLLNPGQVPFHMPELICKGTVSGKVPQWAKPNSVEAFWQANKVIVVSE